MNELGLAALLAGVLHHPRDQTARVVLLFIIVFCDPERGRLDYLIQRPEQVCCVLHAHRKHLRPGPYLFVFCLFWRHLILFGHDHSFFIQILIKFVS